MIGLIPIVSFTISDSLHGCWMNIHLLRIWNQSSVFPCRCEVYWKDFTCIYWLALKEKSIKPFCRLNSSWVMIFNPIDYFCQPVANGFWDKVAGSALGPYKPCCINTLVVSITSLALICICIHRMLLIQKSHKVRRYQLTSRAYHFVMIFLAGLSTSEPLLRILTDTSIFKLDGKPGLPPFEVGILYRLALLD